MEAYDDLKQLVLEMEMDVEKAVAGNKSAGVRARKQLRVIRKAAQKMRQELLALEQGNE